MFGVQWELVGLGRVSIYGTENKVINSHFFPFLQEQDSAQHWAALTKPVCNSTRSDGSQLREQHTQGTGNTMCSSLRGPTHKSLKTSSLSPQSEYYSTNSWLQTLTEALPPRTAHPTQSRHAPQALGSFSCCYTHAAFTINSMISQLPRNIYQEPVSATRTSKHLQAQLTGRSEFSRRPSGLHFWLRLSTQVYTEQSGSAGAWGHLP